MHAPNLDSYRKSTHLEKNFYDMIDNAIGFLVKHIMDALTPRSCYE